MRRLVAIVAGIAISVLVVGASPAQAQYSGGFTVEVYAGTVVPGEAFSVSGTCEAGGVVTVGLEGSGTLASGETGTDGTYSIAVTLPELAPGDYTLTTTCGGETQRSTIHVGDATGGTGENGENGGSSNAAIVRTGASGTGSLLRWGGVLVLGGAAFVLASRRYRTA